MTFPRRGEIHLVEFDPSRGHEIQKTRPALVIQNDIGNRHSRVTSFVLIMHDPDVSLIGYRVPGAPTVGRHPHYTVELFALDTKLDVPDDDSRPDVLKAMDGHILAKAVLVGRFHC